jgi:hypothetical protein
VINSRSACHKAARRSSRASACPARTPRFAVLGAAACVVLVLLTLHREPPPSPLPGPRPEAIPSRARLSALPPRPAPPAPVSLTATPPPDTAIATPPADLVAALNLPPGEARAQAFGTAIDRWILNEPGAAATWIPNLADPVEFDRAAALLVIHTDTLHRPTALALGWAEDIADPELRRLALTRVFREWAERSHDDAFRYVQNSPALTPAERDALLAVLTPSPPET